MRHRIVNRMSSMAKCVDFNEILFPKFSALQVLTVPLATVAVTVEAASLVPI